MITLHKFYTTLGLEVKQEVPTQEQIDTYNQIAEARLRQEKIRSTHTEIEMTLSGICLTIDKGISFFPASKKQEYINHIQTHQGFAEQQALLEDLLSVTGRSTAKVKRVLELLESLESPTTEYVPISLDDIQQPISTNTQPIKTNFSHYTSQDKTPLSEESSISMYKMKSLQTLALILVISGYLYTKNETQTQIASPVYTAVFRPEIDNAKIPQSYHISLSDFISKVGSFSQLDKAINMDLISSTVKPELDSYEHSLGMEVASTLTIVNAKTGETHEHGTFRIPKSTDPIDVHVVETVVTGYPVDNGSQTFFIISEIKVNR